MKITMSVLFGVTVPDGTNITDLNLDFDFSKVVVIGDDGLPIKGAKVTSYGSAINEKRPLRPEEI